MKLSLVSFKDAGFAVEPRYYFFGWSVSPRIIGRVSVIAALKRAKSYLPKGHTFKIWDCKRSYAVQELMMKSFWKRIGIMYPNATLGERKKLLLRFGGGLVKRVTALGTHRNGGSIDLTIVDQHGRELYMGTDHDDLTDRAATEYFEGKKKLDALGTEARKNRRLLVRVLKKAGFVNYAPEWWHWSYKK